SVATDSAGNIIVSGGFSGTVDFGGVALTVSDPNGWGITSAFVAKYSPNGSLVWVRSFGGSLGESSRAVAVDASDNILVEVQLASANVAFGSFTLSCAGTVDIALAKLSPGSQGVPGTVLWAKRYGGANY